MTENWKKRGDFQRVGSRRNHFVCQWCGKHFVASNAHPHKYCSDECRANSQKAYNTKWQAENRKRKGMSKTELEKQRFRSREYYAKRVWNRWLEEADNIMKIVENTSCPGYDVKNSIAKYLSENFRRKGSRERVPNFNTIYSAQTAEKKLAESLGDTIDN